MQPALFFLAKTMTNLEDAITPPGQKSLHAQLRRSLQEAAFASKGNEIGFGNQNRQTEGGVDLNIVQVEKKGTDGLQQIGPLPKARWRQHAQLFFNSGNIGSCPCIDLNFIALLHKRRYLELESGLDGDRFGI